MLSPFASRQGMLAAKHSASASLLEYLPNSRPNCELLGATPDRYGAGLIACSNAVPASLGKMDSVLKNTKLPA